MKRPRSIWIFLSIACFLTASLQAADQWLDNYSQALKQAKSENKLVLADFTGSDWCPPCMLLEKDVFSNPQFLDFAKKNLVLLKLDFPQGAPLKPNVAQQNDQLQEKFGVDVFPTLILLTGDGKEVVRNIGYMPLSSVISWIRENDKLLTAKP